MNTQIVTKPRFTECRNSQDVRSLPPKTQPLKIKNKIESEIRNRIKPQTQLFDSKDMSDSEIEDNILKDPSKRKLMIWLLPHIKNQKILKSKLKDKDNE